MKIIVRPISRVSLMSRLMICAWMETSSALTGSSAMMSLRLDCQRPRDGDALALAAAEFVRIFADVARRKPTRSSSSDTFLGMSRARHVLVRADGLGQRVVHRHARVERRVRVLENHLEIPARVAQGGAFQSGEVAPAEHDLPGGRRDQLEDRAPERGFAAAGFADQAEHLAFAQGQVDAVHRLDRADLLLEQEAFLDGKVRLEVNDFEKMASVAVGMIGQSRRSVLLVGIARVPIKLLDAAVRTEGDATGPKS